MPHKMKFKIKSWFGKFTPLTKEKIADFRDFVIGAVGYGILLNYMLWAIWHVPFKWYTFFAFGILYYFVSYEFPRWFLQLKARR